MRHTKTNPLIGETYQPDKTLTAQLDAELLKCRVTALEEIDDLKPCWFVNGKAVGTLGNISMFLGKAKQGKTFAVSMALAAALKPDVFNSALTVTLPPKKNKVIYFDTEQSRPHVQRVVRRIAKMVQIVEPENLLAYGLRPYSAAERVQLIEHCVNNRSDVGLVIIDGIRDLILSINDDQEAADICSKLMKWSANLNIHICVVLHMNKGDQNARGHLGTELLNKVESTLSVTKQDDQVVVLEAVCTRDEEPDPLAFTIENHDGHGIPTVLPNWSPDRRTKANSVQPYQVARSTHFEFLRPLFLSVKEYESNQLHDLIRTELKRWISIDKVSRDRGKEWVAYLIKEAILIQVGTPKTRSVRYRLNDPVN